MKSNFDTYKVVEKVVDRINVELILLKLPAESLSNLISKKPVYNAAWWEVIRVIFRLLHHSIYKNDPNQGNFNINYVQNSRKILDSNLFEKCTELIWEWNN